MVHAPGQCIFIRFGKDPFSEPHPFTIASSPFWGDKLTLYIKKSGDWTDGITDQSGEDVRYLGPYGLFSYMARKRVRPLHSGRYRYYTHAFNVDASAP